MNSHLLRCLLVSAAIAVSIGSRPDVAFAQGTPADYARAEAARGVRGRGDRHRRARRPPSADTHRFWYRKTVKGDEQFVVVDADTRQKQPAFDHEKIARALSKATGNSYTATALPFNTLAFTDDGAAFTVNVEGAPYRCTVADSTCRKADAGHRAAARGSACGRRSRDDTPRMSPDGKWEALINNYNVADPSGRHAAR